MSVTCCPLSSGDGVSPSCSSTVIRRARKEHSCGECSEPIRAGDRYQYISGIWDGYAGSYKTCLSCVEIRDHFNCGGFVFGTLWEELEQNFFPDMKAGGPCMEGLSPAAKLRLFDRRMAWWEENAAEEMEAYRGANGESA